MFTGIIQAKGEIVGKEERDGDLRLVIRSSDLDWHLIGVGDSIATSGICLTAVQLDENEFIADVSVETIALTTVGSWEVGTLVNLETSLTPTSSLGGHIVSGHVDGVAEVVEVSEVARAFQFGIRVPRTLVKYLARKGSVAIDGTSLTINTIEKDILGLTIVPHTMSQTTMGEYKSGTKVNIEVDMLARYVEQLMETRASDQESVGLNMPFLAKHGYLSPDDWSPERTK